MTAAMLLLGLSLGQPTEPDYYPLTHRAIKLPIVYKKERSALREVMLFVSRDQGATWELTANAKPTEEAFVYQAKDDGVYWFQLVTVDLKGAKDPVDLTKEPPALKVLVDTAPPVVRITEAKRVGDEIVVQWMVEDKFWDEASTKVFFRDAGAGDSAPWREVILRSSTRTGVRFSPGIPGAVQVKVIAQDLAGTKGEAIREVSASGVDTASSQVSVSMPSPTPSGPGSAPPALATHPSLPASGGVNATSASLPSPPTSPADPLPPPMDFTPQAPAMPPTQLSGDPASGPLSPALPASSFITPGMAGTPAPASPPPMAPKPIATGHGLMTPASPAFPSASPAGPPSASPLTAPPETPQPIASTTERPASWMARNSVLPGNAGPGSEGTRVWSAANVPVLNKLRFDLAYEVEQKGPSGISRVDLWVTRDDGRTWTRWSQHDGRESPIRVALDMPSNRKLEGLYGFRLVPVSGAGLSDSTPSAGDTPELRVIIDVTPPTIELFQPTSDPHAADTLVIPWRATDDNFGDDPISIEWSESLSGPWKPVTAGEGVVTVGNIVGGPTPRQPNTGRYAWKVPASMPTHKVYLKVSARDLAGNVSEVITPNPVLVDLARPRARIQGIVPASATLPAMRP